MKLLVISDLHIGNGDSFQIFKWKTKDFIHMLDKIIKKYKIEKVVLNGDTYELHKYKYEQIEHSHKKLIRYFKKNKFIFLKGNHDHVTDFGDDSLLIENQEGKKIYIEHGHNADFFNGTIIGRWLSKLLFKILKIIIKVDIFCKLYFKLIEFDDEVNHIPKKYNSYKYLKYALKLCKKYDVVILGHTHKIEIHKTYYLNHKKHYFNSGSCSLGRFQGIVLNTETLRYDSIKIG